MRRWRGVIAQEGVETGDHRLFEAGGIYWRSLPRDFGVIFEDGSWGHENAVTVGTVDVMERRGGDIYAEGTLFDNDANADRYANMLGQGGGRNVSVDVCAGTARYEICDADGNLLPDQDIESVLFDPDFDGYLREVWETAEICSLVAARTCAFADTLIELFEDEAAAPAEDEVEPVAASGLRLRLAVAPAVFVRLLPRPGQAFTTITDLPTGEEVRWIPDDGDEASATVTSIDAEAGTVTVEVNGERLTAEEDQEDEDDDAATEPVAASAATARDGALAGSRFPRLAAYLARERGGNRVVTASGRGVIRPGAVIRASVAWEGGPPAEFFARLDLPGPTPFTITDDGEIFGHVAVWGQCHAGHLAGDRRECLSPPSSPSEYRTFYANRQVRCSDGSRLRVGVVTMDTMHASAGVPGARPSLDSVMRHYEHTGTIAGYVRAFDDDYGVQVHGVIREGLTTDQVRCAMASAPSGDWRDYGEGLDLAGILLVNQPGYPVVQRDDGTTYALVASVAPRSARVVSPRPATTSCGCGDGAGAPAVAASSASDASCGCGGDASDDRGEAAPPRYQRLRTRAELARMDRLVGTRS